MKKNKKVECEKLDEVICDICGQSCKKTYNNEFASLSATWGYDSSNDFTRHEIDICENCFNKTIQFLKQIRTVSVQKTDPLDGFEYGLS